jgi:hypothetical protein
MAEPSIQIMHSPRAPRRRTLYAGVLIHGPAGLTTDCALRDLSDDGARVRMAAVTVLTSPIILLAPSLNAAHEVQVVWQSGPDFGVRFVRNVDLQTPTSDIDKVARRIWLERCAR